MTPALSPQSLQTLAEIVVSLNLTIIYGRVDGSLHPASP